MAKNPPLMNSGSPDSIPTEVTNPFASLATAWKLSELLTDANVATASLAWNSPINRSSGIADKPSE